MQAVQLAIAMGLRAIVIDTGAERKETCLKYGADEFIDFKEVENPVEKVLELTGGGAHAVFVTGKYEWLDRRSSADFVIQLFNHTPLHKASSATELVLKSCALVFLLLESTTWRSTLQHSLSATSPSRVRSLPVWLMLMRPWTLLVGVSRYWTSADKITD
jgi:hypothetical protein